VIVNVSGVIAMLRLAVAATGVLSESVTFTTNEEVPPAVGVPEIAPVEAFSESPAGKLPELKLHV
jgi:hypothetical protein